MSSHSASATSTAAAHSLKLPSQFKVVGILLAVTSGALIGSSFVFKKKGLLATQGEGKLGEGVGYLKSPMWWTGMIMMIIGEICNFAAYSFVEAIVVTPMGALSVVICAILSHFFLNESLTTFGVIGCALCIVGSVVIALNGPKEETVGQIRAFQKLFLAPGFLAWTGVVIAASVVIIIFFAPKYGDKSMLWYISVCSLIGGLSVSCTTGLGAAIVTSIMGDNQFTYWFIYFLLVFVAITLITEIFYLNKALALFNTHRHTVTPTYYVIFTSATLVTSIILFQGLKAPATAIITIVMGFFTICMGITILQMSKVDPTTLKLDRRSTILLQANKRPTELQEKSIAGFEDPGIDALRGGFGTVGSIIRARSMRKSIASGTGPMSPAVEQWRLRHPYAAEEGNSSAGNIFMPDMKRHQLYDAPVPRQSTISTSTAGDSSAPGQSAKRQGHKSIKFGSEDTRHFYPSPGLPGEARHDSVKVTPYSQPTYSSSDVEGQSVFAGQQSSSPPPIRPLPQVNDPFQDRLRDRSGSTDSDDERNRAEDVPLTATLNKPYPYSGDRDEDTEERYGLVGTQNDSVRLVQGRRK
ncbi:DUF803-domain-containing protein [Serendipita vermifera]|nr:DUF803-domain-containing protein [Serendipita vermifera]